MIISFALVALVNRPRPIANEISKA
jgi:hypothetical protein